jgi:hypothetical protein
LDELDEEVGFVVSGKVVECEVRVERRRGMVSDFEREWEELGSLAGDLRHLEFFAVFEKLEQDKLRRLAFEPQFGCRLP